MKVKEGFVRGHKKLPGIADDAAITLASMKSEHGLLRDDPWHEALTAIPAEEREFYQVALRRGEKLSTPPRVHINTIHGVKGGEADHVVLLSDMAMRTYNDYISDPEDEHRVAYVAASRARHSLSIVMPQGTRGYPYP